MSFELTIEPLGQTIPVEEDQTILDRRCDGGGLQPRHHLHHRPRVAEAGFRLVDVGGPDLEGDAEALEQFAAGG